MVAHLTENVKNCFPSNFVSKQLDFAVILIYSIARLQSIQMSVNKVTLIGCDANRYSDRNKKAGDSEKELLIYRAAILA